MTAKSFLEQNINEEINLYFSKVSPSIKARVDAIIDRWSSDEHFSEAHRFEKILKYSPNAKDKKVLDMSSGCGSFVLQGLKNEWDVYGIEPEDWKQKLIDLKFEENQYPQEWRSRVHQGVGEKLPFESESFDVFDSWQTFEHVQNVSSCLSELYRVLKPGGTGIIHCPSYSTFFEGHYRMFWFPMMGNSALSRFYLRMRKRPLAGLKTFVPINHRILISNAKKAGFDVQDIHRMEIYNAAKGKIPILNKKIGTILLPLIFALWKLKRGIQNFGRQEKPIHLFLSKNK